MKNLSIKTQGTKTRGARYKEGLKSATTFLNHSEDRITVIKGQESVNIEIHENGETVFLGDKYELFEKLKS